MSVPVKIISGGQTGADQAGLDAAIRLGIDYGGAVPKGRRTEDGPLDPKYDRMVELDTPDYAARTEKNVLDADATIIFTSGWLGAGVLLTMKKAIQHGKPYLHIDFQDYSEAEAADVIRTWLRESRSPVINIAGTRESKSPGMHDKVFRVLVCALSELPGEET